MATIRLKCSYSVYYYREGSMLNLPFRVNVPNTYNYTLNGNKYYNVLQRYILLNIAQYY